jgi:hypothetical protein
VEDKARDRFDLPITVPMHRALKVYDTVSLICEELEELDDAEQSQGEDDIARFDNDYLLPSLSALAKTCKSLYEPVM